MGLLRDIPLIIRRRRELSEYFETHNAGADLSETCIPSYVHGNIAAAAVSWWRLSAAADMFRELNCVGPVLDFGASTGELAHMLRGAGPYHFVELDDVPATALRNFTPSAQRIVLESLPQGFFAAIFALDSLEHNDDFANLIPRLFAAIRPGGYFILSGPTENALYQLGRRIAGFSGEYHTTNVYDLEQIVATQGTAVRRRVIPGSVLPLFRLSVWQKP
jgi:SAM-dependent methyltransferase